MIQGHGDDIHSCQTEIKINFSSNVYAKQDMSELDAFLSSNIHLIHSYPEPDAFSLAEVIANKYHITTNNIAITNGATEGIYLIAQAFREKSSTIIIPTFSEYEDACAMNKHKLNYSTSLSAISKDTDLVWLCNPNNPDGKAYDRDILSDFISHHPHILFIIDQSYVAFTEERFSLPSKTSIEHENLIILHSLTKCYAIPGLRLGYLTAHDSLIKKINTFRMPWSVNRLAIEAGKFLIEENKIHFNLKEYLNETSLLVNGLKAIDGLTILPTSTHFFLCRLASKKAADLKSYLIEKHGILIRDASNFRGLDEHYFRIATQSTEENNALIKALKSWI